MTGVERASMRSIWWRAFLGAEGVAPHLGELWPALEHLVGADVALLERVGHHAVEDRHLEADRGVADMLAKAPFARLAPPRRVLIPAVLSDQVDLGRAAIGVERRTDDRLTSPPARVGDLAGRPAALLVLDVFRRDLAEGAVEDRNIVLDAEAQVGALIKGELAGRRGIGGLSEIVL